MNIRFLLLALAAVLCGCNQSTRESAMAMTSGNPDKGKSAMAQFGCASCHTIPGVRGATGLVGPPLTHMASRMYIGGVLQNTPENMLQWLQNPPGVDHKTAMPNLHLTEAQARDIAAYLYTLK